MHGDFHGEKRGEMGCKAGAKGFLTLFSVYLRIFSVSPW
jgi:hypothetical protein